VDLFADPAGTMLCVLRAGTRRFRVAASDVVEVVPWPRLTAVPGPRRESRATMLGVFLAHDAVVPVFRIDDAPAAERAQVVIVRAQLSGQEILFGIAADECTSAGDESAEPLDIFQLASSLRSAAM